MFKPLNDRVLVKPDPVEESTSFGLMLVENKEKPATGMVIVGSKMVKNGARVLFSKYAYDEVVLDRETHYVIAQESLLGIFD